MKGKALVVSVLVLCMIFAMSGISSANMITQKFELFSDDQVYFSIAGALSNSLIEDDKAVLILSVFASLVYELVSERNSWEHGLANTLLLSGGRQLFQIVF